MSDRLLGRSAIITGAARGIGYATATLFLQEGARVGLIDFDAATLSDSADRLARNASAGSVFVKAADIADTADIAAAITGLAKDLGGVDILVNNASARAYGTIADATPDSWDTILQTNVKGLANCCRAALPYLRKSKGGSIVIVSSAFALVGRTNMGQYDATKAAMLAMTRVLACEEAAHGIRVNAVCPGSTLTPWTVGRAGARGMSLDELKQRGAVPSLLDRWAEPEEIAYPILWLASNEASFITGTSLVVDGGLTAM
jgi:meso-butanediol dehydrogenase/(S,S)-butanediol dehydrogenase/diacetyl reductase